MDELDYKMLIDSFAMTSLGDILDSIDKSGLMRSLAELLYIHKMPVREIYPFLIDYGKMARKKGGIVKMVWCGIACFLAGSVFGYLVACYGYMLIKKEEKEKNNHA